MTKYRAIVSIEFDDDDLAELAENIGVDPERMDPHETIGGVLDNLEFSNYWVEQLFQDGRPTIARLSGGIQVEINPHDE